ncbi:hypothetical protein FCH28_26860 [Streptomyces piniterrae]|uniref:Uncharacterized protein n=1 Tax=Streptomyces piniterrae TaxID=2571125 RepID=A0A4U0MY70_9ACTN|nr:hypothetical protein [Streptomyces piniterrae]TJZ46139.1 hypothetical protein FCH28_26860 [Streptomyces piniterrae]
MGTTRTTETTENTATTEPTGPTDKRAEDGKVPGQAAAAEADTTDNKNITEAEDAEPHADADDLDIEADAAEPPAGVAAGAGSVVAAGLGLASVTGTWLGTLMAERQTLLGQIKLQSGRATDQIGTVYGAPWHTTALVNGLFALLAMLVATVVLSRPRTTWVRAVAWGGLALGVLGLLISAGMYLDLFASLPSIPKGAGAGS